MRLLIRLSALATVMVTGLALAVTTAAATPAPHGGTAAGRATASGPAARPPANTTSNPTPLWADRVGAKGLGALGQAIAVSPGGSTVFVAGEQLALRHGNGMTVAYNATTGARIWRADRTGRSVGLAGIALSPDGSTVFVTGQIELGRQNNSRFLTVAYNATTGTLIWQNADQVPGAANSIAVSPDGSTVFITGREGSGGGPTTIAYNATTGAQLWAQSAGISDGFSVAVSPDGSAVFVTGHGGSADDTAAYNAATGATLWAVPATVQARTLAVSPDGSTVFVTGWGKPGTGTQAYDAATGTTLWRDTDRGAQPDAVAVSPDGSTVYVTGSVDGTMTVNGQKKKAPAKFYGTKAYNAATGAQLWKARYRPFTKSPAICQAVAIMVSPDGSRVFITGQVPGQWAGTPAAYGTVAYDTATGARLWAARHYSSHDASAAAIAVSPDGSKVFITGELETSGPPVKFHAATLAYNS